MQQITLSKQENTNLMQEVASLKQNNKSLGTQLEQAKLQIVFHQEKVEASARVETDLKNQMANLESRITEEKEKNHNAQKEYAKVAFNRVRIILLICV
jgi:chromosome segregation ATPase